MENQFRNSNCWNCKYQQVEGVTFLGQCIYFTLINEKPKEIPPHIVDVGCKYFIDKQEQLTLFKESK